VAANKKILVIVLMIVLVSSVGAGASTLFTGTPSTSVERQDINIQLNSVIDFCLKSLPEGTPECDNQLGEVVVSTCKANNNDLDACMNDRVNQYYAMRNVK
jgi:hypothetical protein